MFCEKCGNEIKGNEKFCPSCGSPIEWNAPSPQAEPQTAAPVTSPQSAPNNAMGNSYSYDPVASVDGGKPLTNYRTGGPVNTPPVNQQPQAPVNYPNNIPQTPPPMQQGAAPVNQSFNNGYYPPQMQPQKPTASKTSTGAIVFAIIAAVVIIAEIVLFIFPGFVTKMFHSGKEETDTDTYLQDSDYALDTSSNKDYDDYLDDIISNIDDIYSDFDLSSDIVSSEAPSEPEFDLSRYNTTRQPTLGDFLWYSSVMSNGKPEGRTVITDSSQIVGGWKAYIIYDPRNRTNNYAEEFLNIDITQEGSGLTLCFDWDTIFIDDKSYDKNKDDDTYLSASWDSGVLSAIGSYKIDIGEFYEYDNHQYAIGTLTTIDGIDSYLLMVRP